MIKPVSRAARKALGVLRSLSRQDRRIDDILFAQGEILARQSGNVVGSRLQDFEFKVYSQWGEDGIIQELIRHIDIPDPAFVEFGVQDFKEANCRFLMMRNNWRGLVIEANERDVNRIKAAPYYWRHELNAVHAFVTADNINEIIDAAGFGGDVGLLSVDIDGVDYWVLKAIENCRPRIWIVEYNAVFGADRAIAVPYDANFVDPRNTIHTCISAPP